MPMRSCSSTGNSNRRQPAAWGQLVSADGMWMLEAVEQHKVAKDGAGRVCVCGGGGSRGAHTAGCQGARGGQWRDQTLSAAVRAGGSAQRQRA
jgi:hypothetical protein